MSETAECQNDVGDLDAEEELVGSAPSQKNWKGVVIALLVIVSILLLIACAIFALAENVLLYLNSSNGNLMRAKFYNSNNTAATGQHSSKAVYKVVLLKSDSR
uniref:SEA domain-containing protein n=1 Tax=Macrostomum lignano TaxID=282301 RepID=A0A1I8I0Y4_9PLAT